MSREKYMWPVSFIPFSFSYNVKPIPNSRGVTSCRAHLMPRRQSWRMLKKTNHLMIQIHHQWACSGNIHTKMKDTIEMTTTNTRRNLVNLLKVRYLQCQFGLLKKSHSNLSKIQSITVVKRIKWNRLGHLRRFWITGL